MSHIGMVLACAAFAGCCYLGVALVRRALQPSRKVPAAIEAFFPLRGRWLKLAAVFLMVTACGSAFIQPFLPPITLYGTRAKSCRANLWQIESAKEQWSLDSSRELGALVTSADLIGPERYIKSQPRCPAGGTYTLGALGLEPTCSAAAEHAREVWLSQDWRVHFGRQVRYR